MKDETKFEDVINALKIDQKGTYENEDGALQFVIGIGDVTHSKKVVYLHEQYKTQSDLDIHNSSEHMNDIKNLINLGTVFDDNDGFVVNKYRCTHVAQRNEHKSGVFCLNIETNVKPEFRTEFIELMISHQMKSKNEPKCIQFDWGESADTPNAFYQHEQFADKDGFHCHESTAHFAKFAEFNAKDPYTTPQNVSFFTLM